jgi:hypothetical protein
MRRNASCRSQRSGSYRCLEDSMEIMGMGPADVHALFFVWHIFSFRRRCSAFQTEGYEVIRLPQCYASSWIRTLAIRMHACVLHVPRS